MANTTLILGRSGTGKTTSLRNLVSSETFIISVLDKPMPFRGYRSKYKHLTGWDDPNGNYYSSSDWQRIIRCIQLVNERKDIKCLIIDDFNYIMSTEYVDRASETGYQKYTELAQHVVAIINALLRCRDDLYTFVISHNESDANGFMKIKTIGKLLDEKLSLEGMFTTVLHSMVKDNEYKFITQSNSQYLAKSPMGMFEELLIDNDLHVILNTMKVYNDKEEEKSNE